MYIFANKHKINHCFKINYFLSCHRLCFELYSSAKLQKKKKQNGGLGEYILKTPGGSYI